MLHRKTLLLPEFGNSPRHGSVDVLKKKLIGSKLKRKAD
jgi:hypothetical protein